MPELPALTVADVRDWTADRYYQRGERYFRDGRLYRLRRHDHTLKALCRGSRPKPYRVEVTIEPDGIGASWCSCPVGGEDRCKHAVAVLLAWIDEPEAFEAAETLTERIEAHSTDTLVTLVQHLIDRDPSLEPVVELHLDRQDFATGVDVRDYVEHAFHVRGLGPDDRRYARRVAENLDPLLDHGREYLDSQEWGRAANLFRTVADAVCERLDALYDDRGHLTSVVDACGAGLRDLLATAEAPKARSQALEAAVDICLWGAKNGGPGMADAARTALRKHTTSEERRSAAEALRRHLPSPPSGETSDDATATGPDPGEGIRRVLGPLLLDLEGDHLAPNEYLDLCRRTGQWEELIDRLLKQNRSDTAIDTAIRHLPDHRLTDLADRLVEQGADQHARSLLKDRFDESRPSPSLLRWLYEHARERDDHETALEDARRLFWTEPSVDTYEHVRWAATRMGNWSTVRTGLFDALRRRNRQDLLVRLHLHEDDIEAALEVVEPFAGADRSRTFDASFLMSVAEAVEDTHPEAAVALYEERARALIDQRGRANYADAARLLRRAKRVCEHNDASETWTEMFDTLREEELHRLPAARDEFLEAGLME